MTSTWVLSALWLGLALVATLLAIWIKTKLRESSGSHLKEELCLYRMALSNWSEQVVRKLEAL